jgi:hypothetical protein
MQRWLHSFPNVDLKKLETELETEVRRLVLSFECTVCLVLTPTISWVRRTWATFWFPIIMAALAKLPARLGASRVSMMSSVGRIANRLRRGMDHSFDDWTNTLTERALGAVGRLADEASGQVRNTLTTSSEALGDQFRTLRLY